MYLSISNSLSGSCCFCFLSLVFFFQLMGSHKSITIGASQWILTREQAVVFINTPTCWQQPFPTHTIIKNQGTLDWFFIFSLSWFHSPSVSNSIIFIQKRRKMHFKQIKCIICSTSYLFYGYSGQRKPQRNNNFFWFLFSVACFLRQVLIRQFC